MIEGRHYQNAYVTRNIEKAVAEFTARADVRLSFQYEGTTEVTAAGGSYRQTTKLAFIWVGDLQYEFIEPVTEPLRVFTDWLPQDDALRFHHSCTRVVDWDGFRRRVDQQPLPVVFEGEGAGLKFLYLDARELLGHYLEFTAMSDEAWARMGGR
jgi:hypothetical protein